VIPRMLALILLAGVGCATNSGQTPPRRELVRRDGCGRSVRVELPVALRPAAQDSSVLIVRATALSTMRRWPGAKVLLRQDSSIVGESLTDEGGTARLAVRPGRYRLELVVIGMQLTWADIELPRGAGYFVDLPLWEMPIC
jgi:hypothetical protein